MLLIDSFLLAVGCERFADDSSLVVLNEDDCEKTSKCSGEKQIDLFKTSCSLLPENTQYIHNDTWNVLKRIRNGSFAITVDVNKVFLKVANVKSKFVENDMERPAPILILSPISTILEKSFINISV